MAEVMNQSEVYRRLAVEFVILGYDFGVKILLLDVHRECYS